MSAPVSAAEDLIVTRSDDIELVTVESLDPDAQDGSDVVATATGVRAIVGKEMDVDASVGGGTVSVKKRNFTLIAGDLGFGLKSRDRITRTDGTKWITVDVTVGGFGELYDCPDCVKETG